MATKTEIRVEAMEDILLNLGISATPDQIKQIVKDYDHHIDMEREMDSHAYFRFKEECEKCKSLEYMVSELKKENDVFRNSVKQRRNASSVWIENDEVKYNI